MQFEANPAPLHKYLQSAYFYKEDWHDANLADSRCVEKLHLSTLQSCNIQ